MRRLLVPLLFGSLASSGCDLIQSATATTIVSGLVIASPELKQAGFYDVPSQVVATSWVGKRASPTSTAEPTPITGATVTLSFGSANVSLKEQSGEPGVYLAESTTTMALKYQAGANYMFDAVTMSDMHGGDVDAPPQLSADALTFTPALGTAAMLNFKTHEKNAALSVSWDKTAGRYAYVTVLRSNKANPTQPSQVYDTRPKTAQEILNFIFGDPPAKVDIPASTFAQDGLYAVILVAVNKGMVQSNTFAGSPILAGSGAASFFAVGTP
ncbi:MAG: hypothetical protein U1E65_13480 [Myxococcota bacterium]